MTAASRRRFRVGCSEQGQACGLIWSAAHTCSRLHCVLQTRTRRAACRTMTPPNLGVGYNDTSPTCAHAVGPRDNGGAGNLCRRARPMILNRLCRACAGGRRHHPNHNKQGDHHGHLPHPHPHAQRGGGSRCVQLRQEVRSRDPGGWSRGEAGQPDTWNWTALQLLPPPPSSSTT